MTVLPWTCRLCGWSLEDREEQTCHNPDCSNHWTYKIADPDNGERRRNEIRDYLFRREETKG